MEKTLQNHESRITSLEKWKSEMDIFRATNQSELRILIAEAVKEGQLETIQEVKKIETRVDKLERREGEKAQEELKNRNKNNNQIVLSVITFIITALISFFSGFVMNSLSETKSIEQKIKEQIEYQKRGE